MDLFLHFVASSRWNDYICSCHGQVKEEMLIEALTTRKTITVGEKLIVPYKLAEVRIPQVVSTINTHYSQSGMYRMYR